jgi:DNA repair exonuclease SbcCD nuclease subunit
MKRFAFILLAATAWIFGLLSIPSEVIADCPCSGNEGYWKAVILSDLHVNGSDPARLDRIRHVVDNINAGKHGAIDFVVVTGDAVSTIQHDSGTESHILQMLTELNRLTTFPYYYIALGNHDYRLNSADDTDVQHTLEWLQYRESIWSAAPDPWSVPPGVPKYESFDYNGWRFFILNSYRGNYISASRHFDAEELNWLSSQLASAQQQGKLVTIFMHHPLKTDHFSLVWGSDLITSDTDPGFYNLLNTYQDKIKHIFVGHGHHFQADTLYGKIQVRETASLGESSTRICRYPKYIAEADFNTYDHKKNCD